MESNMDDLVELWDCIDHRVNEVTDETLQVTERIVNIAESIQKIGRQTLEELNHQGERLEIIQQTQTGMELNIKRFLKSFEWISCKCCLNKQKENKVKINNSAWLITTQPTIISGYTQNFIKKVAHNEKEEHIERNLQAVSQILNNLDDMSQDIAQELRIQNTIIAEMTKQTTNIEHDLRVANRVSNL